MASLTFQNFNFFWGLDGPKPNLVQMLYSYFKILECLERHLSGSQACRGSPHGPTEKEMCHLKPEKNKLNHSGCLLTQILFHYFVCLCICIFFLFYYPTLSLLCMFQYYNDNLFCGWTSSCFFIWQNLIVYFAIRNKAALRTLMQIYLAVCITLH